MSPRTRRAALIGGGTLAALALLIPTWGLVQTDTDEVGQPTYSGTPYAQWSAAQASIHSDGDTAVSPVRLDAHWADSYVSDRVMAKAAPGESLAAVAADLGGELLREPGRSGYAAIALPTGTHPGRAVEALRSDPRIAHAGPVGIVRGASVDRPGDIQKDAHELMGVETSSGYFGGVTVAVLDSGVAYENYTSDGVTYKKAYTFNGVSFPYPYDFVNNDSHANDDHMHGTHIASVIASKKQVSGGMHGAAPGAAIMPIKVLDENNSGNEMDLIDGLWHAIDNDADIINMSLAFGPNYLPSAALQEVLRAAYTEEIPMVAAAGNDAEDRVAWPAASAYVIAIGAACPDDKRTMAPYSNRSQAIVVSAIGGCSNMDDNGDGWEDGLLGETIVAGDPSQTQYVLWSGTSQATAMASATLAQYMTETYIDEDDAWAILQDSAEDVDKGGFGEGTGAGVPQRKSASFIDRSDVLDVDRHMVSVLPYLHREGDTTARPAAVITVSHENGELATDGNLYLTVRGSTTETAKCKVNSEGQCHFKGDTVDLVDGSGNELALGWSIEVDAYERWGGYQIIEPALFVTDGLEVFAAALEASDSAGLPMGVYWPENTSPKSGVTTSEAFAWTDSGVGFASSPLGVVFTPPVFPASAITTDTLDLDGVGFSSSPLGTMGIKVIEFGGVGFSSSPLGGVGFASSPLGLSSFKMAVFDGVGFSSSPLGLDAFDIWAPHGVTVDIGGVGFSSSPLGLSTLAGPAIGGTNVGDLMDDGGWTVGSGGYSAGTGLIGAAMVDTTPTTLGTAVGDGWQVCD